LCALFTSLKAQAETFQYKHSGQHYEIGSSARYFEDTTNLLTYKDILRIPDSVFTESRDKIITLDFLLQIGSVFQAVFMTFALSDRIQTLRKEFSNAQALALKYNQENYKMGLLF
jgi:hypothetical protein